MYDENIDEILDLAAEEIQGICKKYGVQISIHEDEIVVDKLKFTEISAEFSRKKLITDAY